MKRIKIVADSSCDLFSLCKLDFTTAPMKVSTDERDFIDREGLDVTEMVNYLSKYKGRSKSSCPNTEDWLDAFDGGEEIYCVTITSGLSGSFNSASVAARIYESENPGSRVFVLDSLSAGPEMTLIVEKLEELVRSGATFDEVCEGITEYKNKTALLFMLKSLRNFANNGRVSPIVAKLCGIAGIAVIGRASEKGTLEPLHKCRGEQRSLEMIVDEMEARGFRHGKISIGHCQNPTGAARLRDLILARFAPNATVSDATPNFAAPSSATLTATADRENVNVETHEFRGLCAFYAEIGGILVGFECNTAEN